MLCVINPHCVRIQSIPAGKIGFTDHKPQNNRVVRLDYPINTFAHHCYVLEKSTQFISKSFPKLHKSYTLSH